MIQRYLRAATVLLVMLTLVVGLALAKDKSEAKLFKDAQAAENKEDWDRALELYLQLTDKKPNDAMYMIGMRRARFQSGAKHVKQGQKTRTEGKLQEAMQEFQKALIADPASSIAIQEIKRTQQMLNAESKTPSSKTEDRGLTPAERERKESDARISSMLPPPELKPVLRSIGPLVMHNQPLKIIYETMGKMAGVNVLFDTQLPPSTRNFNVDLPAISPEGAFDYLGVETHTFWKAISPNTIFVSEDNATKHRDFDDEIVKTVYVTNMTSVQDFQEIVTAVRALTELRRTFSSNAQKAIIMRGPTDAVALGEKVIRDLDKPKAEVVIDVIVMQANTARTRDLAASIVNSSGATGLTVPFAFSPTNPVITNTSATGTTTGTTTTTTPVTTTTATSTTPTTTGSSAVGINQLSHISSADFSTSLPGALLNMIMTDSKTKVLNNPTVRASDGMKVSLAIGQKIPYATGSFQPGVGTVGVSPLVSTQFNFAEVGVNVDITPQVHSTTEVTLHVEINVSSVAQYVSLGGISQPVISQNKSIGDIRLREGEVNILAGLSTNQDTKSYGGIPGLTDIPVLGHVLFGNDHVDKEVGQLMIALVPHIIRTPDYTPENYRGIAAGNDTNIKLFYAPKPDDTQAAPAVVSSPASLSPTAGQVSSATPATVTTPVSPSQPVLLRAPGSEAGAPTATTPVTPTTLPGPPTSLPAGPPASPGGPPASSGGPPSTPGGPAAAPGGPVASPGGPPAVPGVPSSPTGMPSSPEGRPAASGQTPVVGTTTGSGGPPSSPVISPSAPVMQPSAPVTSPPAAVTSSPAATRITFAPATVQGTAGNPVTVNVQIENATDLFSGSPIHISFDPAQLRLNDLVAGDLFTRDGARVTSQKDIRNDTGDATLTVARLAGTSGVSGSGAIATLTFVAVGHGTSTIKVTGADLKNSQQQSIPVAPGEVTVKLQ